MSGPCLRLSLEAAWGKAAAAPGMPERWKLMLVLTGSQTTDADRDAVAAWADRQARVLACELGALHEIDAA